MKTMLRRRLNHRLPAVLLSMLLVSVLLMGGCATPDVQSLSDSRILDPDQEDDIGGSFTESGDIRTVAVKMCGELLSTPEIANGPKPVRIAIAPIKNSTRFLIDKDIFMKRLRIEMNKYAKGQVRFFSQGMGQQVRHTILQEQTENQWFALTEEAARSLVECPVVAGAGRPLKVALIPVKNTNLVGVNADSLASLVRSQVYSQSQGKVMFLAREGSGKAIDQVLAESDLKSIGLVTSREQRQIVGADYFLGGEFIAMGVLEESAQEVIDAKAGLDENDPRTDEVSVNVKTESPNVTKYLNLMLINADTAEIAFQKLIPVEKKMQTGLGNADYILTGELSALSKAAEGGKRSDYVIMSFQLVNPHSNELLWEDAYETKRTTNRSVLYR
ncbi:hypothetical protein Dalk_3235 [Desulfatibacillum aliphaticivorans]|uniref:Lipoprotein n=1 Tax=Desulfatibacillum aliphaticivorans TaxID=218208 RepID=B8FGL6_DESAL|nr:hypothetical protein [Desulfatibacillum aliphaticivorans]ACL04925.1 hypothetical protein Dalk_3235 [Desulfatibacillum aliphaticivorans]